MLAGSHLLGALLSLAGILALAVHCSTSLNKLIVVGVYGLTLVSLFVASSLLHGVHCTKERECQLEKLDYMMIYFFIAGSYTPVCMYILDNPWANIVLAVQWNMAIIGIYCTAKWGFACKIIQVGIFLVMGWMFLMTANQISEKLSFAGYLFLLAGCGFYSVGAFIFAFAPENFWRDRVSSHLVWHIFVMFGATAHYCMIYGFMVI